ncbi:hypothetical protein pdam_00006068 [Pocillopora damicornis]|uniref:Uncharacterized protein n=1 Tax=Pocillopora damicornis TaxID=46731 RepID=A0A3M6TTA6_POCDA|nr:hypothetical protein pdam_00006068 [Pocillopora damicornis]
MKVLPKAVVVVLAKDKTNGSHPGNEGNHNGHCQYDNFSRLLISMVLATRQLLFCIFVNFS